MEFEHYNCPHCYSKDIIITKDNLCPNCKQVIEISNKVTQEISLLRDANSNFNKKDCHEKIYADVSSGKKFGIAITCFGLILFILSIVAFGDIFKNDKSYFGDSGIPLAFILAIAGWVISILGLKLSNIPINIQTVIKKIIYRFVIAYFLFLGWMYLCSMMGP